MRPNSMIEAQPRVVVRTRPTNRPSSAKTEAMTAI
jgi:hypothetical protein